MKLVIATEYRFIEYQGRYYSTIYTYEQKWSRYLNSFDEVYVISRVHHENQEPAGYVFADAPNVHFIELPGYIGPYQYLLSRSKIKAISRKAAEIGDAFVLFIPGIIAYDLWKQVIKLKKPYGVEVIGDPWGVFRPKANKSILRPYLRRKFTRMQKMLCAGADAAAYVTRQQLQKDYPPGGWSTHFSAVNLKDDAYISDDQLAAKQAHIAQPRGEEDPWVLVNVGSMDQVYKRQDLLIEMVARLRSKGLPVRLILVGYGRYRPMYEECAQKLGIADYVTFTGSVSPGQGVREQLDRADVFVLASETEGLANVLMEAGARGLPIISTDVGGSSEFVDQAELVPPSDLDALTQSVGELLSNPGRMKALASENLDKAKEYHRDILTRRAWEFSEQLRKKCGGGIDKHA